MNIKKIFIYAYTKLNLGDDLFVKILIDRYPDIDFYLVGESNYNNVFKASKNLHVLSPYKHNIFQRAKNLLFRFASNKRRQGNIAGILRREYKSYTKSTDSIVVIGGSLFQQYEKKEYYYDLELFRSLTDLALTKPIFFLGCNFGPFISENYKNSYEDIFAKAVDVSFREELSYNHFKNLPNVRYNPDIVYSFKISGPPAVIEKSVGFSIVGPLGKVRNIEWDSYVSKYRELVSSYIFDGYKVKLFSFCKDEGDEDIINEISEGITDFDKVSKVFYNGDIDSFISDYRSVEKVFCGRFHAMILSMLFGQEIYPIVYSKKMINVLNDIQYQGKIVELEEFHHIDVLETKKNISSNKYDISKEITLSNKHFETLDNYLRSNE